MPADPLAESATAESTRRSAVALGVVVTALLFAGCARLDPPRPAAPAAPGAVDSRRPSAAAPTERRADPTVLSSEQGRIEAAYRRFWTVTATIGTLPTYRWRAALSTVAIDPLLSRVYDGIEANYKAGIREYGVVRPRPTVVSVGGGRASVLDCQDASMAGEIDADTGLPKTVGSPRTPVAATLVRGTDGTWRLSDARYLDGPC